MKRLLILFLILSFLGCKSKKKAVERSKQIKTENVVEKKDLAVDSTAISVKEVITKKEDDILEVIERETVIKKDSVGEPVTTIKEVIKRHIKTTEEETKKDTDSVNVVTKDNTVTRTETEDKNTERKTDVDVKTTSTWLWLIFGLIGLLATVLLALKYRPKIWNR